MRLRVLLVVTLLCAPLVPLSARAAAPAAVGVVAVVDEGINPYHQVFRDRSPLAQQYPGTYLPGYPSGVPALRLDLDAPDLKTALAHDCPTVWSKVQPGRLYWVPGTKLVGVIDFAGSGEQLCGLGRTDPVLDTTHGTMSASRVAANGYGACPSCRLVAVRGIADGVSAMALESDGEAARRSVEWVGRNASWIDAQTNSWSPPAPHDPTARTGILSGSSALARTVEDAARRQLVVFASGNGASTVKAGPPRPTLGWSHATPSVLLVGGHDSGHVLEWPNLPVHLAGDACADVAADGATLSSSPADLGGGTSAASPWVTGGAVRELMTARRLLGATGSGVRDGVVARGRKVGTTGPLADGVLTLAEWRRVLLTTASPRPTTEPQDGPTCTESVGPLWSTVPDGAPEFASIGYGAVDARAQRLAEDVLSGKAPMPDRSRTDSYLAARDAASQALHEVFSR